MREHWKRLFPLAALLLALLAPHCRALRSPRCGAFGYPLCSTWITLLPKGWTRAPPCSRSWTRCWTRREAAGFNAIFFQVRPCADSFYPSQIFPYSVYLTGQQGQSPDGAFVPLAYLVEQAHARQMQVHAWINPYRVTQNSPGSLEAGLNQPGRAAPGPSGPFPCAPVPGQLVFATPASPRCGS